MNTCKIKNLPKWTPARWYSPAGWTSCSLIFISYKYLEFIQGVTRKYLEFMKGVTRKYLEFIKCVTRKYLEIIQGVTRKYLEFIQGVTRKNYGKRIAENVQIPFRCVCVKIFAKCFCKNCNLLSFVKGFSKSYKKSKSNNRKEV